MPAKKKIPSKPSRIAPAPAAARIASAPYAKAGPKTRYSLSPIIISTVGLYLLVYFGFLANISESFRTDILSNAGMESLQANLWAFAGILMIFLALVLYLAASQWYDKKAYYIPEKDRVSFREDLVFFSVAGLFILLVFLGCSSSKLIGVSANIVLPFIILASVLATGGFLYVVYKNAGSLPYLSDLDDKERTRLMDLVFDKPASADKPGVDSGKADSRKTLKNILPIILVAAIAFTLVSLLAGDPFLKSIAIYMLLAVALFYILVDIFVMRKG